MEFKVTFDVIPILGALLVILAWYVPGFNKWFEQLGKEAKQLVMLCLIGGTVIVAAVASYFGLLHIYTATTWQEWVWYPFCDFIIGVMANTGVYVSTNKLLSPKQPEDFTERLPQIT